MTHRSVLGSSPNVVAHAWGRLGWLGATPGDRPAGDARELLAEWTPQQALAALAAVPAWRLLDAASVELGSRVHVFGTGWLGRSVERLARMRGVLLVGSVPAPDAVIVAGLQGGALEGALRLVARNGVVAAMLEPAIVDIDVYPDLHRRGLRLNLLHSCAMPTNWLQVRQSLAHYLGQGLLGT